MGINILRRHFNDTELRTLEEKPDYREVVRRVEQFQADNMLDALETRITERISQAQTLDEKWEAFTSSLDDGELTTQDVPGDESIIPQTPEELRTEATNRANEALTSGLSELGRSSNISIFGFNVG
ncbi:hypothetical protein LAT59_05065, partial [Candidatus Gracilibacteria bacterium]|nr:hypothetical protein [Candidatus Gracilibacteria bacterium]